MKKILALLLAVMMLFTFAACDDSIPDGAEGTVGGVDYYHYDTKDFNKKCDRLEKLAATDQEDEILELYDELSRECAEMDSLYAVIYIKYSTDVNDSYYSDEQLYSYKIAVKSQDRLCGICRSITEGPSAEAFRGHVGDEAFDLFAEHVILTKQQRKLRNDEQKLVDKYNKTMDAVNKHPYKYGGRDWTINNFFGERGNALAEKDYVGYIEIYDALLKYANKKAGPLFLDLLALRTELAESFGYDNYADFSDENEYYRDYSPEDLEKLYGDVRKISESYYSNMYDSLDYVEPSVPKMTEKELLSTLQEYSYKIDKLPGKTCDRMIDETLYTIGNEDSRQDGAFTTYIHNTKSPFISMKLDRERDFPVLTHEFGHFVEYNKSPAENTLASQDNADLSEIASNGFEGLMTHYYDDIFGEGNTAENYVVDELLYNIFDGCIFDEFQREVYANPNMTLEEINETYAETYAKYNTWVGEDDGFGWVLVSHNFEAPMYYISYAVSALAALQIWNMSHSDFEGAVDVWLSFVREGTNNRQYFQVIDKAGLARFTEPGAVKKICKPALRKLASKPERGF